MVIGQVGDVSCRVIAILQLSGELATVLEPEKDDRGEGYLTGPRLASRTLWKGTRDINEMRSFPDTRQTHGKNHGYTDWKTQVALRRKSF